MKTEKWLVMCFVMLLIQLVACERGKMQEDAPVPLSARMNGDSLGLDSLGTDSTGIVDSTGIIDSTGTVDSTVVTDSSGYTPAKSILADDIIRITPAVLGDSVPNTLMFRYFTDKKYFCRNNALVAHVIKANNAIMIDFDKVITGVFCGPGLMSQATGTAYLDGVPANFNGGLEVRLNDKVYKGTIKRTGKSHYEFVWADESRIVITKKSL